MKFYQSHKRVRAAQITAIEEPYVDDRVSDSVRLFFDDGRSETFRRDDKLFARYMPVVGDYLVQYEDSYRSFSPKKAFEEGYTPIPADMPKQIGGSRVMVGSLADLLAQGSGDDDDDEARIAEARRANAFSAAMNFALNRPGMSFNDVLQNAASIERYLRDGEVATGAVLKPVE